SPADSPATETLGRRTARRTAAARRPRAPAEPPRGRRERKRAASEAEPTLAPLGTQPATTARRSLDESQEALRPLFLRRGEELVGRRLFDDLAVVHHQHCARYVVRETELVRDDDHGRPLARKRLHHVEHLAHEL